MTPILASPSPVDHEPIEGERLRFRSIEERDLPDIMRWQRDPEVAAFFFEPDMDIATARTQYMEPDVAPCWRFVIELDGRGVGEIQYWHPYAGEGWAWSAGIDIFIGEPYTRDRGTGTEAIRTMLRYLFETLGCHRVTIDPEPRNARAIRCYEKAGFRFEAVLRHYLRVGGEYVDAHFMSILEDEWPAARARWEAERDGGTG